jgi:hypothetical protein
MDDAALMALRAHALFDHDADGRMVSTNEPRVDARRPAPRLFIGSTRDGRVVRFGAGLPDTLVREIDALVHDQQPAGDLRLPQPLRVAIQAALERHAPVSAMRGGPAYRFPEVIPEAGDVVAVTAENRRLVRATFPWLDEEIDDWQPCFAALAAGEAVSVCFSSRIGGVVEAGVETLEGFRGRGYATAVTAAWARAVRATGRIPVYSTAWENVASQRVARRLGLVMFGEDMSWA